MSANLISLDSSQLKYVEQVLNDVKNGLPKAIQGAINTSLTASKRDLYTAIKDEYNLQKVSSRQKEAITIQRASPTNLSGTLHYRGMNIPLVNFKVTPSKPVKRNPRAVRLVSEVHRGKPETWRSAFIAKMPSSHNGVFIRTTRRRTPIKQQYSTSVPQMIQYVLNNNPQLINKLQSNTEYKLNEQVEKILAKAGK